MMIMAINPINVNVTLQVECLDIRGLVDPLSFLGFASGNFKFTIQRSFFIACNMLAS